MKISTASDSQRREILTYYHASEQLLEECRMVLPGLQALFGFQLIAVFNSTFSQLSSENQRLHLVSITLVVISIALIMTPAAYHRQTCPREVTSTFLKLSSRFLLVSMLPLSIALSLDFYLIAQLILHSSQALLFTGFIFLIFIGLWFIFPRIHRHCESDSQFHKPTAPSSKKQ
ncbi:MAG: DUF6328 family protein [Verrucomicrobiota bacterium]